MESKVEQKPNKIKSIIKDKNKTSTMFFGQKDDGTLYWGQEICYDKELDNE